MSAADISEWYDYNFSIALYFPNFLWCDCYFYNQKIASIKLYTDIEIFFF